MKKIEICNKEYNIDSNAMTYLFYKKVFNRGILEDVSILKEFLVKLTIFLNKILKLDLSEQEKKQEISQFALIEADKYIEVITRITYILIYTANNNFKSYEDFMKGIPKLSVDDEWVFEVTELAVDTFC